MEMQLSTFDWMEKVDHLGIAVRDPVASDAFLRQALGAVKITEMEWGSFVFATYLLGNASMLELVWSSSPGHFINRFIEKRGEGIHHVTLKVKDLHAAVEHLKSLGIECFDIDDSNPAWKEAFIHPRDALGVLIQLAEYPEEAWFPAIGTGGE
jgi:methylmalonyl-CoA/ethylmalonyl-CoA epimerase